MSTYKIKDLSNETTFKFYKDKTTLSQILGVTERRVRQLIQEGVYELLSQPVNLDTLMLTYSILQGNANYVTVKKLDMSCQKVAAEHADLMEQFTKLKEDYNKNIKENLLKMHDMELKLNEAIKNKELMISMHGVLDNAYKNILFNLHDIKNNMNRLGTEGQTKIEARKTINAIKKGVKAVEKSITKDYDPNSLLHLCN